MGVVRKAILPVAGLGTRILPATKSIPKEMLPVYDRPLVQWAVEEAINAGIEEIILVTSRGKHVIEDHFDRNEALEEILARRNKTQELDLVRPLLPAGAITSVRQHSPVGLGHAILMAKDIVGQEPFAVLLPDDFCQATTPVLSQLIQRHNETGGSVLALQRVPQQDTGKYGIASISDGHMKIEGLVEKPDPASAPSNLAVIGRYVLDPTVMNALAETKPGAGGEIQLTDAIAAQCSNGTVFGHVFSGTRWDCGTRAGWLLANLEMGMRGPESVTIGTAVATYDELLK